METGRTKVQIKNHIKLYFFCTLTGATAGGVVWLFLKIMSEAMGLIWEWIPGQVSIPFYTILVCTIGGIVIGLFRRKYGDYPEDLETVIGKVKKEKHYEYKNMLIMLLAALLPLLMGSSVGPEAGLTGVIVGLCYWVADNLKAAGKNTKEYSEVGVAVSLSVLFHAPLFGIFQVQEEADSGISEVDNTSKIIVYGLALAAGTGIYAGLSHLFGAGLSGFPSFDDVQLYTKDYVMMVVYILCGCVLAFFYQMVHKMTKEISGKVPAVWREILAGICLGVVGTLVPCILFSGEEQMGTLMEEYETYLPIMLIGIAFLKIVMTNLCIQFGLKGGHFFPVIFAGVSLGYGIAMLVFEQSSGHVVFAAAMVTAALLGGIMKKPLAVTMLLFLCFPIKLFIWIFLAAAVGSKVFQGTEKQGRR